MPIFLPIESRLIRQGFQLVAGIDEVGRGPLAGPVVSAAVILNERADLPGLDDSKKLSAKKRLILFQKILDNAVDYAIAFVPHQIIDRINIINALRIANDLCINAMRFRPDIALIDGRDKQIMDIPFLSMIEGDSRIRSIAAASILAKVARDAVMTHYSKEYPEYGFERHMGYGTRFHRNVITKIGFCEIHRKSYTFKP